MRIGLFPAHDDSTASSRIRVFTLQRSLEALGHDARLRDATGADVLVIQKRATSGTLKVAGEARRNGALIVYDVDDVDRDLWLTIAPNVLYRLLQKVDLVTTDTAGHRDILIRDYAAAPVEIVDDTIDYYPTGPVTPSVIPDSPLRVLWFGNVANISLFENYARVLKTIPDVEIVAVTNASSVADLSQRIKGVSFVPWSRESFVGILQSCALSVLPHDGSDKDRAKSNNRMIASITWGVPAIVSRTIEYERTAREAGVTPALFNDETELVAAIEHFRSREARRAYLAAAQPEIWRLYSPEAVARKFLDIVARARRRRDDAPPTGYLPWLRRASHGHIASALVLDARHVAARMLYGSGRG
jgi:glycosyltransferase involved in cell wall biosynthesis